MTICGTEQFMAPEIQFGEAYNEKAVRDRVPLPALVSRCMKWSPVACTAVQRLVPVHWMCVCGCTRALQYFICIYSAAADCEWPLVLVLPCRAMATCVSSRPKCCLPHDACRGARSLP